MKVMTKFLVLLLVFAMLLGVTAGCGEKADEPAEPEEPSAPAEPAEPAEPVEPAEPAEPAEPTEPVEEPQYFPLDEPQSVSFWMSYPPIFDGIADNGPEDFAFYKEAEAQTNVHIDWSTASFITARDAFSVLIAGGEYPDVVWGIASYYTGSFDGAIEDEFLINHKPYIEQYMSNLCKIFDSDPTYWKDITTDGGNIAYVSMMNPTDANLVTGGWVVNTDLLGQSSVTLAPEEITTIDEITEIATTLKNEGIVEYPIWMPYTGFYYGSSIGAAFGTSITFQSRGGQYAPFYYNENDELCFGGVGENFKNYLAKMNEWYEAGLIDPDFISETQTDQYPTDEAVLNRQVAFFRTNNNYINYDAVRGTENEVNLAAIPEPRLSDDQQLGIGEPTPTVSSIGGCSVTTGCPEDKYELVFKYLDWFYSDAGYVLCNYGVEGVSFNYDDAGVPHFTDVILNPEEYPQNTVISFYTGGGTLNIGLANYDKYDDLYNDLQKKSCEVWASAGQNTDKMLSQYISLTTDELNVYTVAMGDILTYISENAIAFIRGERSLDEYADYEQIIFDRGIEDVIAVMEAAQARYEAR